MQLQQLSYIVEVAKTGSMNKAAQHLFISQPNLSSAIANLERELNVKIFNRTNKGVEITPEGTLLLKYARSILGQVDQLKDFYSEDHKEQLTVMDISQTKSLYVTQAISNIYNKSNYHLKISLNICSISDVIKNVFTMKSELGIISVSKVQKHIIDKILEQKKLEYIPLVESEVCVVVNEKSDLCTRNQVSMEELSALTYVSYLDENTSFIKYSVEFSELWADSAVGSISVNDLESLRELLNSIASYSFDLMSHQKILEEKGLKCIPLTEKIEVLVGAVTKKYEPLAPTTQDFMEEVERLYRYKFDL